MRRIEITMNRREYHILHDIDDDPYPEEYGEYRKHKPGCRGFWKQLMRPIWPHQMRMYRTWKHTRGTQWKPK